MNRNEGSYPMIYGDSPVNPLALYLLTRSAITPRLRAADRGGLPRHRLRRVIDHIDENLSGDLTLARLAAVAGVSRHYFAELFRQRTGRTPHQYVLVRRIEFAKQRLRGSRLSVIEVGLDAGFKNPSHFARVFRRWVGVSPTDFRAESRESHAKEAHVHRAH